ncbi:MAG TPA: hypothetical protein VJ891_12415 [Casimicrobiaceae bacterium]|nr:hypothetical protein [Casimicrobiaceae bacterium]
MTLLLGALMAAAPFVMDVYLASMPSMTRALDASTDEVRLTLSATCTAWEWRNFFARIVRVGTGWADRRSGARSLAFTGVPSPLAVILPMFAFMVTLTARQVTMPRVCRSAMVSAS